ncbi:MULTISPECIES: hypothetical protein [Hyphomicrobiales]|uniref:hypothetical protein n=1 Tax=Hyphomicrobiales TaxID=356 RepID=UPI001F3109D2|nr:MULTISPECIES: hypothetical protein [Hyphomicrobiales]
MVAPSRNHLSLGTGQVLANAGPRNHLNLRSARPCGGPFAFERNRKNASQFAAHVDLQFIVFRSQDDLSDEGADEVGGSHPLGLTILLKRRV